MYAVIHTPKNDMTPFVLPVSIISCIAVQLTALGGMYDGMILGSPHVLLFWKPLRRPLSERIFCDGGENWPVGAGKEHARRASVQTS